MKYLLLVLIHTLITSTSFSQDTLKKKTGEIIICKILEIDVDNKIITYKNDSIRNISKTDVKKIKIVHSQDEYFLIGGNTFKYKNVRLNIYATNDFLKSRCENNKEIIDLINKSCRAKRVERRYGAGLILFSTATLGLVRGGFIIASMCSSLDCNKYGLYYFGGAALTGIATAICINRATHFRHKRYFYTKQAVRLYHQSF
ncbi:MAG: hypothetical protein H0W84_14880 [Bacteroidetes bacterium]|nr:hypothetical protein [Bacteroidota bacterium]